MKIGILTTLALFVSSSNGFVPLSKPAFLARQSTLDAKYKTMDEILAKFPEDLPVLINFYDAKTENEIKNDILRAKTLLKDRCTLVSIKQQDYPEIAKLWDADQKSPAMILFRDGQPVMRLFEETHYLEIVSRVGQFCENE
jgi:thioredoxin-like negative regulator of GroEL